MTDSPFAWRTGQPSAITKALGRTQTAPKTPATPITYSKKPAHALRRAQPEAQKVGSKSRAPTANISTPSI